MKLSRLCERDRWTCHLCGGLVPEHVPLNHPLAASCDHVIPRIVGASKGIPNGMNIALAHRWCNSHRQHKLLKDIPDGYFDGLNEAVEEWSREHSMS